MRQLPHEEAFPVRHAECRAAARTEIEVALAPEGAVEFTVLDGVELFLTVRTHWLRLLVSFKIQFSVHTKSLV